MMLDHFTLHSDKPDALYFAVDLADADLDEFGQAMLAEQELRRRHKVALIYADASRATTECYLKKNPPDPIACQEKPRTEKSQSRFPEAAALNAPVLESGATVTAPAEFWSAKCDHCGIVWNPRTKPYSMYCCGKDRVAVRCNGYGDLLDERTPAPSTRVVWRCGTPGCKNPYNGISADGGNAKYLGQLRCSTCLGLWHKHSEPIAAPAPPATEYRRWWCTNGHAPSNHLVYKLDCEYPNEPCHRLGCNGIVRFIHCDESGLEIAAGSGKRWFMSDYGGFFEIDGKKLTFVQDNGERICQAPGQDAIVLSAPWCHEITESAALAMLEEGR